LKPAEKRYINGKYKLGYRIGTNIDKEKHLVYIRLLQKRNSDAQKNLAR